MRISSNSLASLSKKCTVPTYPRPSLQPGILHISLGAFHRAHQAVYMDDYLNQFSESWMIVGVGLMPHDINLIQAMQSQDNLYTVLQRSSEQDQCRIIGSIKETVHGPSHPEKVIDFISDKNIKIISLTITEKGYWYNDEKNLDVKNILIAQDILLKENPKTIYGYILKGLQARRAKNSGPVTILSCDNLPGNGELTRHLLLQFASAADSSMVDWIKQSVSFPNSMVDRITPATTPVISQIIHEKYQIDDKCPVLCENYRQWIIEDNFIASRPGLDKVGVQFVKDVEPYEKMKVRLLNGSHSALSYIAYLMQYRIVDKALSDPLIVQFIQNYMKEDITPTLSQVEGIDLIEYQCTLLQRFSNSSIQDQIQRLAEDGSQKIRNALIPPLLHQLQTKGSIQHLVFALAAWYRYLNAVDEQGQAIEIKDPLKNILIECAQQHSQEPRFLFEIENLFDRELLQYPNFLYLFKKYITSIHAVGIRQALTIM